LKLHDTLKLQLIKVLKKIKYITKVKQNKKKNKESTYNMLKNFFFSELDGIKKMIAAAFHHFFNFIFPLNLKSIFTTLKLLQHNFFTRLRQLHNSLIHKLT
jgi:hypothetical protein